jgi:hypothetical protein
MDTELLNFWTENLGFMFTGTKLFVHLKAYKKDPIGTYVICLTENKKHALAFLGYDTSVEYDLLTEKNLFAYLDTSMHLVPEFIRYCSFKGPYAKNKLHECYNKYLIEEHGGYRNTDQSHYVRRHELSQKLKHTAISYFGKQKEYEEFKQRRITMDKVFDIKKHLKEPSYDSFRRFLLLNGIKNVIEWDITRIIKEFEEFTGQNWSCLLVLT